jgi:hypothetical protein
MLSRFYNIFISFVYTRKEVVAKEAIITVFISDLG